MDTTFPRNRDRDFTFLFNITRLLHIDYKVITFDFRSNLVLLATQNPDVVSTVVNTCATTYDVFRKETNLFVCVVDGQHWNVLHGQVGGYHTEQTFQCFSTRHICNRLFIDCIFEFFLRCKVTNGVDDNDDIIFSCQFLKLTNQVKLEFLYIRNRRMQNSASVNPELLEVRLG